jgi:hypothetical protein
VRWHGPAELRGCEGTRLPRLPIPMPMPNTKHQAPSTKHHEPTTCASCSSSSSARRSSGTFPPRRLCAFFAPLSPLCVIYLEPNWVFSSRLAGGDRDRDNSGRRLGLLMSRETSRRRGWGVGGWFAPRLGWLGMGGRWFILFSFVFRFWILEIFFFRRS